MIQDERIVFDELLNIADQSAAENDLPHYSTAAPIYSQLRLNLESYNLLLALWSSYSYLAEYFGDIGPPIETRLAIWSS